MLILLELWQNKHTKSLISTHDIMAKMQQCCLVATIIILLMIIHKLSVVIIY